jgi:hypothetical protein
MNFGKWECDGRSTWSLEFGPVVLCLRRITANIYVLRCTGLIDAEIDLNGIRDLADAQTRSVRIVKTRIEQIARAAQTWEPETVGVGS